MMPFIYLALIYPLSIKCLFEFSGNLISDLLIRSTLSIDMDVSTVILDFTAADS